MSPTPSTQRDIQIAELRAAMANAIWEYIDDIGGMSRVVTLDEAGQRNVISQAMECAQQARQRWFDARVSRRGSR